MDLDTDDVRDIADMDVDSGMTTREFYDYVSARPKDVRLALCVHAEA